jgi:4-amino-4-deoxy-L-arabinose transferase-like glycosyltransferase
MALYREGVTRWDLLDRLPHVWLYAKGFGLTVLLVVSALGIGLPLLTRLVHVEGRAETVPFAAGLGLGAISLLVLLAGVLNGLYTVTAWAILGGGVLLAAVQARWWRTWARSIAWRVVIGGRRRLTLFYSILLFSATVSFVYALTANGLTPPFWWDEAAYHLALPKLYVDEHRIFNVPFILYSNQPFNLEMLFTLALLLRSEIMASLVSLVFAVVLSAGLWLFALKAIGRRTAFLAVILFWVTPALFRLAGSTLIEVPLAAYAFLSVWAFWRWHTEAEQRWGWLILAAVLGGLAAGTKLTGALIPIILAVLLAIYSWRRRPLKTITAQVGLLGGVAFLLVLPWYLKSYFYTGNPVWPFLNDWFNGLYWDALGDEYHYAFLRATNLPMTLGSLLTAPWHFTVRPYRFGSFPLGLLIVPLAPLALVFRLGRGRPFGYLASVTGLFYVAWFAMTHQTRFLMPVVPCLCLLSGHTLDRLLSREGRLFRLALQGLVAGIILLEMPGIQPDLTGQWALRLPYLLGTESREELLSRYSDVTAAYIWANEHLPADAKVLLMPFENRGYLLDRDYLWASAISQRVLKLEQYQDGGALWRNLREKGITHVLDNPDLVFSGIRYWPRIEGLLNELKTAYADPIYARNGTAIYGLH